MKVRPTRIDLLRANYDNLDSLRNYFRDCNIEVMQHLNSALQEIRLATTSYQKLHCSEEMGFGLLQDDEAIDWKEGLCDR
jgi:hypothetical protein